LFADDALEWKAEQDAAAQAQAEKPDATEDASLPFLSDTVPDLTVAPDEVEEAEAAEELGEGAGVEESAGEDARATAGQPPQQAKIGLAGDPGQETGATDSEPHAEAASEE